MSKTARILTIVVVLAHLWIMLLECVLWTTPLAQRLLHMTAELAEANAILAMNQGAYNGLLAAGLVWALMSRADQQRPRAIFFLVAVVVLGLVGAVTSSRFEVLLVQALPGIAALVATKPWAGQPRGEAL